MSLRQFHEHFLNIFNGVALFFGLLRVRNAPGKASCYQVEADLFQSFVGRRDLSDHISAVALLAEHLLNTTNLAFNPAQALLQVVSGFGGYLHVNTIYPYGY